MKWFWSMLSSSTVGVVLCTLCYAGVSCDGISDVLTTGIASSNFITSGASTVIVVIKPTGSAPDFGLQAIEGQTFVGDSGADGGYWGLTRANTAVDDKLAVTSCCGYHSVLSDFTNNTWIHLAWVQESGVGLSMYKDGILVSTDASGGAVTDLSFDLQQCLGYTGSEYYNGEIAVIKTFTRVLTAAQINADAVSWLYQQSDGGSITAKWQYSECGEGVNGNGIGFVDSSGNGNTVTATGTTCKGSSKMVWPVGAN